MKRARMKVSSDKIIFKRIKLVYTIYIISLYLYYSLCPKIEDVLAFLTLTDYI